MFIALLLQQHQSHHFRKNLSVAEGIFSEHGNNFFFSFGGILWQFFTPGKCFSRKFPKIVRKGYFDNHNNGILVLKAPKFVVLLNIKCLVISPPRGWIRISYFEAVRVWQLYHSWIISDLNLLEKVCQKPALKRQSWREMEE